MEADSEQSIYPSVSVNQFGSITKPGLDVSCGGLKGEGGFAVRLNLRAQRRVLPPCTQVRASTACVRAVHLTPPRAMGRLHTFVVTLRRNSREVNWGLRIVGGADLATPLIVTRVPISHNCHCIGDAAPRLSLVPLAGVNKRWSRTSDASCKQSVIENSS